MYILVRQNAENGHINNLYAFDDENFAAHWLSIMYEADQDDILDEIGNEGEIDMSVRSPLLHPGSNDHFYMGTQCEDCMEKMTTKESNDHLWDYISDTDNDEMCNEIERYERQRFEEQIIEMKGKVHGNNQ